MNTPTTHTDVNGHAVLTVQWDGSTHTLFALMHPGKAIVGREGNIGALTIPRGEQTEVVPIGDYVACDRNGNLEAIPAAAFADWYQRITMRNPGR